MTQTARPGAECSPWSPRETELLDVTLQLLQEHGYERLTIDAVAAMARASKATVYRRWPSKAELVLAAFIEGCPPGRGAPEHRHTARRSAAVGGSVPPASIRAQAGTIRAVLVETSRHPALNEAMQNQFLDQRKALIHEVLRDAVDRGEIDAARDQRRTLGRVTRLPDLPDPSCRADPRPRRPCKPLSTRFSFPALPER